MLIIRKVKKYQGDIQWKEKNGGYWQTPENNEDTTKTTQT